MKKTIRALAILSTVFGSLMVVFAMLFISFLVTSNTYKTQLENSYMRSFYEVVDTINTLEVDLSKIVATNELSSQRELLGDIYNNCTLGVVNLGQLPLSSNKVAEINKLLNTTSGFAYSLLLENYVGNNIGDEDYHQIESIYNNVRAIQYDINEYMRKLRYDYSILDDVNFGEESEANFSAGIVGTESSNSEVPTLIYDGPFSDSVLNKEIVGLGETIVSQEEAYNVVKGLYPNGQINYMGDTSGKFETYNYEVVLDSSNNNLELYVSITKKGGFLLSITSFGYGVGETISIESGVGLAEDWAKDVGITNMYSVWYQQSGNMLYVNLAPIVDKVIHYSDLIKVKVDLCLNTVVGWEATSYATNHTTRSFESSIGIIEAGSKISNLLTIVERNLCIVPNEFVGESSAYEFICTWKDYTYYIYIDSLTGEELNIMRVIDTSNGQLLM